MKFEVQSLGARVTEYLVIATASDGQSGLVTAFASKTAADELVTVLNHVATMVELAKSTNLPLGPKLFID